MIIGDGLIIGLLGTGKSGFFPSFFFGGREQTSDAVLSLLLSCENRALGTQVLDVQSSAGMGTGRIQRVGLMQTRFRLPHHPPLSGV